MPAQLTFAGAAGGVTGSCYHLAFEGASLVIDRRTFQGGRIAAELNQKPWPFDPVGRDGDGAHARASRSRRSRAAALGPRGQRPIWGHSATLIPMLDDRVTLA